MKSRVASIAGVFVIAVCMQTSLGGSPGSGKDIVLRGVSVYGLNSEDVFPVVVRDTLYTKGKPRFTSGYITIQFDVLAADPPPLKIRFLHCTRDWLPEDNLLIQDDMYNTSFYLEYKPASNGVQHYAYRYTNRFPDEKGVVKFNYSGNWIFRIMDKDEATVYAEGRFVVVDNISPTLVTVTNDFMTDRSSPFNQIQKVTVGIKLPDEIDGYNYTMVDIYQNRRLFNPYRIDAQDRDPYTVVEGYNSGTRRFSISSIHPGNEYRVLNVSNANRFPNKAVVRSLEGVDLPRLYWQGEPDNNGGAHLNKFTGINSDYLDVLFRLDPAGQREKLTRGERRVYLVASFNEWWPLQEDTLMYDPTERIYTARRLLRRGVYDYQYVTGSWDERQWSVVEQDWLELEGNDWRTTNTYTAFVYYNDVRFGGIDRIVGFGVGQSDSAVPGSR
ncbi:MAG: type IX secretion system plug protein domain-containing protein [Bacteroidota bacterium]